MEFWFLNFGRNATQILRRKFCSFGVFTKRFVSSSFNNSNPSPPTHIRENCRYTSYSFINSPPLFFSRRFGSVQGGKPCKSEERDENKKVVASGKLSYTPHLRFISESPTKRIDCYRVLDDNGQTIIGNNFQQVNRQVAIKMYKNMVHLQIMDNIFSEKQRQGGILVYLTTSGEEAINIASAAAFTSDDIVFTQYREFGVLLWRGFTSQEFANQLFGNKLDGGKARQMPIHYGSKKLNFFTISTPIATQIPQAVGAAYSLKMDSKNACAVVYFGDGATSEGDFHAGLNFAAVMDTPIIFICRNNAWAIRTPTSEQFRSDGVVVKGQAYGIRSIRVDGNDALAVYSAVCAAREMAISEQKPILIEALTYRVGDHLTTDDSRKYRSVEETKHWKMTRDPITRYRKWIEKKGWWTNDDETEFRNNATNEILQAVQVAEKIEKPPLAELFTDVYDSPPSNLQEQERLLRETIKKHPLDYPTDVPI